MTNFATALLTGQTEQHLCSAAQAELLGARVHREVVRPFLQLKDEAWRAGFDLQILSGFRSFEQQLSIWNRKATGKLAVLDSNAVPLEIERLSERELVFAILRWSALPGASRHHWGTDLDVYDLAARPEGYEIELIPEEVDAGGMFGPLHAWLDRRIAADAAFGFFRPYDQERQGVAPETQARTGWGGATTVGRRPQQPVLARHVSRDDWALSTSSPLPGRNDSCNLY